MCAFEKRHEVALVARLVGGLHRDDRVARAEAVWPGRVAEVALDKRDAFGERTEVLARELVHRKGEVKRGVAGDRDVLENRACELPRPGAELEDARTIERGEGIAECGE